MIVGIGKAISLHFAKEGAKVAFTYHKREKQDAYKLIVEVELKNDDECEEFFNKVYNYFGIIDILVNNTAVQFPKDDITDISAKQLKITFETNFYNYIYMIKGACIINSTSVTAYKGRPNLIDYSSTKGAIVALTRSLAKNIIKNGLKG